MPRWGPTREGDRARRVGITINLRSNAHTHKCLESEDTIASAFDKLVRVMLSLVNRSVEMDCIQFNALAFLISRLVNVMSVTGDNSIRT